MDGSASIGRPLYSIVVKKILINKSAKICQLEKKCIKPIGQYLAAIPNLINENKISHTVAK
jgi:hypothetical protein